MALFFGKKKPQSNETVVQELPLTAIVPNRFQPRKVFSPEAIQELAATISEHGLLQPIVVREYKPAHYEIIAGERRFRAMQSLHFEKAPAIVQKMSDEESAAMALIENLQREGLSPIEEAEAYTDLMKLNAMTQQDLAKQLGKSQSFVANKLRLLKLSDSVQAAIMNGEISERHGRELLKVDDYHQQLLLHEILANHLTVKETAQLVDDTLGVKAPAPSSVAKPVATKSKDKAKKPRRRRTLVTKDARMAVNTLKQSVKLIQDAGLAPQVKEEETASAYRFIIEIPKEKK
ncbi:nucleoid occlusion protein [Lacticaseibacillus camelliae]|uniref:Nucleoid occlusion protein n=1 Tax=Lacticaseibacillus camelliae DSM 22697 = JCM 13995 TaxID=1423730 RepID=A0A0R2FM52_9LACO|nr:nucleoid occlusion protein [Lacticaseibacillus camelliae]KRN25852.1 nucleoid occlusion protein [Lacticaseibacillus camelliae DSM 22697 = JCM 13995]